MALPLFRAAYAIAVVSVLVFAFTGVSTLVQPPVKQVSAEEWSFKSYRVPTYDDLSSEQSSRESGQTDHLGIGKYCPGVVQARFEIYQDIYPRFVLIADRPRAFQRFLHAMVDRSYKSPELCFPSELIARVIDQGKGRCNLLQQSDSIDDVLRADIDKLIDMIERRHIMTVNRLMNNPTLIKTNRLRPDTLHYLRQLSDGIDAVSLHFSLWERRIRARDPNRLAFIEDAAKHNNFRSVLRSNPACLNRIYDPEPLRQ